MNIDTIHSLLLYGSKIPLPKLAEKVLRYFPEKRKTQKYIKNVTNNNWILPERIGLVKPRIYLEELDYSALNPTHLSCLTDFYLQHRFDLLGSGWVKNRYDSIAPGLETHQYRHNLEIAHFDPKGHWLKEVVGSAHLAESQQIWYQIQLTKADYEPIDWQKDYKSGFRWNAQRAFSTQVGLSSGQKGADLKAPWELSHFAHLLPLAIAAQLFPAKRTTILAECKCQLLDFMATNPVGMGVNFAYALEVGVRLGHWLTGLDVLRQIDSDQAYFDEAFLEIFTTYIYKSSLHILHTLEYREGLYSNHYLGDITGLVFSGVYLEDTHAKSWLYFAIGELLDCLQKQFFSDGGNFEGSTAYHRFSGEMSYWSFALLLGMEEHELNNFTTAKRPVHWPYPVRWKRRPFGNGNFRTYLKTSISERLYRIAYLSHSITFSKKNLDANQFGDNDGASFLHFTPWGECSNAQDVIAQYENLVNYGQYYPEDEVYWEHNYLTHVHLLAVAANFFPGAPFDQYRQRLSLETSVVKSLAKGTRLNTPETAIPLPAIAPTVPSGLGYQQTSTFSSNQDNTLPLFQGGEWSIFPEVQLYLYTSQRVHLAIVGFSNPRQLHRWAHVHNDKLSIELSIDEQPVVRDPGTYVYTPLPEKRVLFRQTASHNGPYIAGEEQNRDLGGSLGLFNLRRESKVELLYLDAHAISLSLRYRQYRFIRTIFIEQDQIRIEDSGSHPFEVNFNPGYYSNGYGKLKLTSD